MSIRLRDLASPRDVEARAASSRGRGNYGYAPALPRSMAGLKSPRKGRFTLCRVFGLYSAVFMLLFITWRMWREESPSITMQMYSQSWDDVGSTSQLAGNSNKTEEEKLGVSEAQSPVGGPSFPLDRYAPMLPNTAPITEITVEVCKPSLRKCIPGSTSLEDAALGRWVRVERNLDSMQALKKGKQNANVAGNLLGEGKTTISSIASGLAGVLPGGAAGALSSLDFLGERTLFYRRSRRTDLTSKVVDVRIVEQGQTAPDGNQGWHRVKNDLRASWMRLTGESGTAHLYFRAIGNVSASGRIERAPANPLAPREAPAESFEPITEIDIIYGPNEPMPGFRIAGQIVPNNQAMGIPGARLAIRRKPLTPPELPTPITFKEDGSFKILQLADLHYSIEHEPCRDVPEGVVWKHSQGQCEGDSETVARVEQWLDAEKPDLVVFTGDQLNGQGTSWDERSVIMKVIKPLIDRKIMWTAILGNHDSQSGSLQRRQLQALMKQMPYSKTFLGPEAMNGESNFYLKVHSPTPDRTELVNLYFFDSGAWVPKEQSLFGWGASNKDKGVSNYDYVHRDQVAWFEDRSKKAKKLVRPYQPDGAKDLDGLWDRSQFADRLPKMEKRQASTAASTLRKPLGIAFMHIPIPEAFNVTVDKDPTTGKELIYGERNEIKSTVAGGQSKAGFFDALMKQDAVGERDVEILVHGHQHNNYDCRRVKGVWICFGGGSSFAGYGNRDLKRRTRVFLLEKWGEKVSTWHRYDDDSKGEVNVLYQL